MKNLLFLCLTFLLANMAFSQTEPIDTLYYPNKNIQRITFASDRDITGQGVRVYYDSLTPGKAIIDTVLNPYMWNSTFTNKPLTPYAFFRLYLDTGIIRTNDPMYSNYKITGIRSEKILTGLNRLAVYNTLRNKYRLVSVYYADSTGNRHELDIANLKFSLTETVQEQFVKVNDTTYLKLEFNDKSFLKGIAFMMNPYVINGKYLSFHDNGFLSTVGFCRWGVRYGIWKEYHDNGRLKSIGKYSGKWQGDEFEPEFIKQGKWVYYDRVGKIIKEEDYK